MILPLNPGESGIAGDGMRGHGHCITILKARHPPAMDCSGSEVATGAGGRPRKKHAVDSCHALLLDNLHEKLHRTSVMTVRRASVEAAKPLSWAMALLFVGDVSMVSHLTQLKRTIRHPRSRGWVEPYGSLNLSLLVGAQSGQNT